MFRPFFISLFFLANISLAQKSYNPAETKYFDLVHTKLELRPDWSTNHLDGKAELTLRPWFYAQDSLVLDAKGFDILELSVNNDSVGYSYDKEHLKIALGKTYHAEETLKVKIEYTAKPDQLKDIAIFKKLPSKGLYFINKTESKPEQIWTEGETEYNSCWFPTLDSPNQKHTQELSLTVNSAYTTLSNGLLVNSKNNPDGTRTDTWKQDIPHAVYLTMIAAGEFTKVIDSSYSELEVSYYIEPKHAADAKAVFGRTPEMIHYFESLLGIKYPWKKYSQIAVRDYVSGAMENTTATVHGSTIQKNPNQLTDGNDDGVIAHELFHHWFGNYVTAESWANLPLNEAFADYAEYLWASHKYGKDEGDWLNYMGLNQYLGEAETKQVPLIRYGYTDKEDMFDSHSYAKGGRILHMLRQEVGDAAFWAALKLYLEQNALDNAEVHDLRQAFEAVSGQDLNWFFNQWFLKPGHPRLVVNHKYNSGILKIDISQTIDSVNHQLYNAPLAIAIGTANGTLFKNVRINDLNEHYEIPLPASPDFVAIDPKAYFLGEIKHDKKDEEYYQQYLAATDIVARSKALDYLTNEPVVDNSSAFGPNLMYEKPKRELALAALNDNYWRIREAAVHKFFDYDGKDFLIVERKLQSLIRTDEQPQVRAAAIRAMKNFLNPQNDLLFREALADTSYAVRAAALEAILLNTPDDADSLTNALKNIDDVNLFMAVGNYKSAQGNEEDLEWFKTRLKTLSGMELYQSMGIFGSYLVISSEETQLKSIPFLKKLALHESVWIGRFAAAQALVLLTEHKEATAALKEIIAKEKEPRLMGLYEQLKMSLR